LFERGLTIAQIAAQPGLAISTIEGHIASLVSKGEVAIGKVLADEKRRTIEQKISEIQTTSLKKRSC